MRKITDRLKRLHPVTIILLAIIFVAIVSRLWHLGLPTSYIYDEAYYVKYAKQFLDGTYWIDVHPILSEVLIALGIVIFGDHSWAWRLLPVLAGIAIIPLSYFIAARIFKNRWIGVLTAFLLTFDGMMLVQSRAALLDIFMTFFVLCGYLFFLKFLERDKLGYLAAAGAFFGLALSCYWVTVPLWILVIVWFVWERRRRRKQWLWGLLYLIVLPLVIYILSFLFANLGNETFFGYLKYWHTRSFTFHYDLRSPHTYGSRWYSWPIMYQPVWYLQSEMSDGTVASIVTLGNPIIWFTAIPAFFYSLYLLFVKRYHAVLIPLLSFSLLYFGWAAIKRPEFVYYIVPVLPFYFMLLSKMIFDIYKKWRVAAIVWLVAVVACFLFFYPLNVHRPISRAYYNAAIWFDNWQIKKDVKSSSGS